MNQEAAWQIVTEFVQDPGLRRHMQSVAAAMRWYARKLGQDEAQWGVAGLLHDFDWEIHPDLERHPMNGVPILRERGVEEDIIRAIQAHATEGTGVERERPIDFALLACDEITGLIIATALVRPDKSLLSVELKSVQKKWKTPAFAAGVARPHVEEVTADFSRACFDGQLALWDHVGNVLEAMKLEAGELGLDGRMASPAS